MSRYRPVAIADRDGLGHPLKVEVAAVLRHNVRILGPDGSVVGEATADGTVYWDPPMSLRGGRVASASVRRSLAANGRLVASVDERGTVLCLRAEYRTKSGSTPSLSRAQRRHPAQLVRTSITSSDQVGGFSASAGDPYGGIDGFEANSYRAVCHFRISFSQSGAWSTNSKCSRSSWCGV